MQCGIFLHLPLPLQLRCALSSAFTWLSACSQCKNPLKRVSEGRSVVTRSPIYLFMFEKDLISPLIEDRIAQYSLLGWLCFPYRASACRSSLSWSKVSAEKPSDSLTGLLLYATSRCSHCAFKIPSLSLTLAV